MNTEISNPFSQAFKNAMRHEFPLTVLLPPTTCQEDIDADILLLKTGVAISHSSRADAKELFEQGGNKVIDMRAEPRASCFEATTLTESDKNNLAALAGALIQIRSATYKQDGESAEDALLFIREIADRVHNVPGFMLIGRPCDAQALLRDGVCNHWPTGLVE